MLYEIWRRKGKNIATSLSAFETTKGFIMVCHGLGLKHLSFSKAESIHFSDAY